MRALITLYLGLVVSQAKDGTVSVEIGYQLIDAVRQGRITIADLEHHFNPQQVMCRMAEHLEAMGFDERSAMRNSLRRIASGNWPRVYDWVHAEVMEIGEAA